MRCPTSIQRSPACIFHSALLLDDPQEETKRLLGTVTSALYDHHFLLLKFTSMSSEGPYGRQGFQSNPNGYGAPPGGAGYGGGDASYGAPPPGGGGYGGGGAGYGGGGAGYGAPAPQAGSYGADLGYQVCVRQWLFVLSRLLHSV
jgi:hypothetical protein